MKITELMNYRFDSTQDVAVDTKILEKFIARDRTIEQAEFFASWSSVSSEALKILPVMESFINEQRQVGITR